MGYSMVLSALLRKCAMLSALILCLPTLASAQRVSTPPTNLKVLPKDMEDEAVRAVMGKFRQALDVRCSYCHAAKEGSTRDLDYASDEKETKGIARVMMKMTQAINNTHLTETGRANHEMVTCETCHHGSPKPKTLSVELGKVDAKEGIDAAVEKYKSLRELYYGRATYDFGENSLLRFVGILRQSEGREEAALRICQLNLEYFPESVATYREMVSIHRARGDDKSALERLEKAMEIEPGNRWIQREIMRLKEGN